MRTMGLILSACLLGALPPAALAKTKPSATLRDRQQAACSDDAQRLCGEFIPDVDKTTACMKTKRAEVSRGCAKLFDVKQ